MGAIPTIHDCFMAGGSVSHVKISSATYKQISANTWLPLRGRLEHRKSFQQDDDPNILPNQHRNTYNTQNQCFAMTISVSGLEIKPCRLTEVGSLHIKT